MSELKPCPFCGQEESSVHVEFYPGKDGFRNRYAVLCDYREFGCGVEGPQYHSKEEAIEAWNRRASGWISVKERLPEGRKNVLCCGVKGGMFVGWVANHVENDGKAIAFVHGGAGRKITHWMPLPDAPEE